jgi:ribonuclease P protein component
MERRLRLRADSDFTRVRAQGRSVGNRLLTLIVAPNTLAHNRYGVVVSKRVGKAVARNLVKRRLREILREIDGEGVIAPSVDLALIVRPGTAAATFDELRGSVIALLKRAAIWRVAPSPRDAPPGASAAVPPDLPPYSAGTKQP